MFDILSLYDKLQKNREWLQPNKIKEIRISQYRMTQKRFAHLLNISEHTYKNWEQGRAYPSTPAQSLLLIARDYPDIFLKNREKLIQFLT